MTTKKVRGPRKRAPKSQGKWKAPKLSEKMKWLWANDPDFKERMRLRDIKIAERRKANPELFKRTGIPDGMTRESVKPLWEKAHQLADRFIKIMKDTGQLPADETVEVTDDDGVTQRVTIPASDGGKAEAALREVFVMAVGPSTQQIKIQAVNTVLAYTKSKPESKSKLTLNKGEEWLEELGKEVVSGD